MRFTRGRKPPPPPPETLPNVQCSYCDRITAGTHADTNPGRQVSYLDERGVYVDDKEAEAAGLDISPERSADHAERQTFILNHTFSHGACDECAARFHVEYLARRDEQLRRREREAAEGGDGDGEGDGEV